MVIELTKISNSGSKVGGFLKQLICVSSFRNVQETSKQTLLDDVDVDNHDTIGNEQWMRLSR